MTTVHTACGTVITFKLVLADDGDPAIVRWCPACDVALADGDCTPPNEVFVSDVPAALIDQLIAMTNNPGGKPS